MTNFNEFKELTQSELLQVEGGSIFSKVGSAIGTAGKAVANAVVTAAEAVADVAVNVYENNGVYKF